MEIIIRKIMYFLLCHLEKKRQKYQTFPKETIHSILINWKIKHFYANNGNEQLCHFLQELF